MSWKSKAVALYKRFGAPVKFAAKLILGSFLPGGSAVVDLVSSALDCVHETVKDNLEVDDSKMPAATAADLGRLESVLDVLAGDLGGLTAQIAALQGLPHIAAEVLDAALKTDDHCRAALHKLDALAQGFDRLREQNEAMLRRLNYATGILEQMVLRDIDADVNELHVARVAGGDGLALIRCLERKAPSRINAWRTAAEQGVAGAQFLFGLCLGLGIGMSQNDTDAARWCLKAAEQGCVPAQFLLGQLHQNGLGVPLDDTEAVKWFRLAADQGNADAQNNLGHMFKEGHGVARDDAVAVRWYHKAAEQGHSDAQNNLGRMYDDGLGVRRDDTEAVKWYRKAAEQSSASAQWNLGIMYRDGEGVVPDKAEAAKWLRMAAEQGHTQAKELLSQLESPGFWQRLFS